MRLAKIARVLAKHGLGQWGRYLGLSRFLSSWGRRRAPEAGETHWFEHMTLARRLVCVLEDMGPTYIKLGQALSTRPDLLPEAYIQELRRLQDAVEPFDVAEAHKTIVAELGRPLDEVFAEFEDEPLACGSIAQAHRARLITGEAVVVKVQRPGIRRTIEEDLDIFDWLAGNLQRFEALRVFRPKMIVDEFRRTIQGELDFLAEAAYTERFRRLLAEEKRVRVAEVYWDFCTPKVLTLQEIAGVTVTDPETLAEMGVDREDLAQRLVSLFLCQFFESGVFQADPHPGNILIDRDGTIGLLDFGMVGHLSEELRDNLATSMIAVAYRDAPMIVETYLELGLVGEDVDLDGLRREFTGLMDRYYGVPASRIDLKKVFLDVTRVAREFEIPLPREFVLLGKAFVTVAGYAMELDPGFNIVTVTKPYAMRLLRDKFSPRRLSRAGIVNAWRLSNLVRRLPGDARRLSRKLLDGDLRMRMSIEEMKEVGPELDRATNRIALSMIVGSVVVGSAVVLHAKIPPYVSALPGLEFIEAGEPRISLLGFVGFMFAAALGLLVAWGIWKHGKL